MWVNLPLFVTRTIDLIKQYNEKGGSQSLEEVIQAITSRRLLDLSDSLGHLFQALLQWRN